MPLLPTGVTSPENEQPAAGPSTESLTSRFAGVCWNPGATGDVDGTFDYGKLKFPRTGNLKTRVFPCGGR